MIRVLKTTWREFSEDGAMTHAAALAFYGLLSLIPFLSLVLLLIGLVIRRGAATTYVLGFVNDFVGGDVADVLANVFETSEAYGGRATSIVGVAVLVIGATALVGHLQKGLNQMFDVQPRELDTREKIKAFIKKKGKFLLTVIVVAVAIVGSLAASFGLNALTRTLGAGAGIYSVLNHVMVFVIAYFFIAFLFLFVPDLKLTFKQVRLGVLITTLMLLVGQILTGLFFRHSDKERVYGFLTGIILLILWLYYSAVVFYFGAELTHVLAQPAHAEAAANSQQHP